MISTLQPVTLDLDGMLRNIRREGTPDRVFYFEHGVDGAICQALGERFGIYDDLDRSARSSEWDRAVAMHRFLGQEIFRVFPPGARASCARKADGSRGIECWQDFENFEWLRAADADLSELEYHEKHLPPDMMVFHCLDVWERVRELFGYEKFCYMLYDDPALIDAVFEKVGGFAVEITRALCDFDCFGCLYMCDDLGYKTSTLLPPETIRRIIIPWHKKLARIVHGHGKLLFLHSCGQMYELLDEYIDDLGLHAKHSFEEAVMPVTDVKRRYGDRLALLGGMDVDFLARSDEAAIRAKTREILDVCFPGGGYCMGSGNWVTSYIPLDNYLAMLDEARHYTM